MLEVFLLLMTCMNDNVDHSSLSHNSLCSIVSHFFFFHPPQPSLIFCVLLTRRRVLCIRLVVRVCIVAALGGLLFGLDIGYISGVENMPGFIDDVHNGTALPPATVGFVTSIFSIGAIVSACPLVSTPLLYFIGRRWAIITGSALFCVGIIVQATSQGLPQMFG